METDEFTESLEFIKMETEEPPGLLLSNVAIANKITNGEFLLRDYNKKGKVWTIFAKIYTQSGEEVLGFVCCKVCGRLLTFNKATNSTSNLVKHRCYILKCVYKSDIQKLETTNSSFDNNADGAGDVTNDYAYNVLTNLFTKCFIKCCRSYEMLQDDVFKAIFQELIAFGAKFGTNIDLDKVIPSKSDVAYNFNEIYENCHSKVFNEIDAAKDKGFGLACHMWTKEFVEKSYFVLTAHFFSSGKCKSRLLGLRPVEDKKCAAVSSSQINDILKNYECELSRTSLIVASESSGIVETQTIPCISTLLSKALAKSMNEIPEISQLICSCRELHRFLVSNQMEILPERHLPTSHWLYLYKLLEFVAKSWDKIEETLKSKGEAQMSHINKQHLEAVVKTLQPFKEALESLEEDNTATLHLVIVYLYNLNKFCEAKETTGKQFNFIKGTKKLLRQYLEKIVAENITIFHKVALFLYPPANKLLQFETEKPNIEAECVRLMQCFKVDVKSNSKEEPEGNYATKSKRRTLFSDFVHSNTDTDPSELVQEELQIYKLTRVPDSEDFDVFGWWEQQQQHFPHLYRLSHMVLSTPATTVAAQRILASVDNLLCDQKSEFCSNDRDKDRIAFVKFNAVQDDLDVRIGFS